MLGDACPMELRDPGERLSVDELRSRQLSLLQATVRRAYENVPHYRAALDSVGVDFNAIRRHDGGIHSGIFLASDSVVSLVD